MRGGGGDKAILREEVRNVPCPFPANMINPRHMHEGYGSHSVCVCVCLSVTTLTATYLVCESKLQCYKVPYGVPNT